MLSVYVIKPVAFYAAGFIDFSFLGFTFVSDVSEMAGGFGA